ncbi:MAG: class I SAM-dependent methyltransferase [Acidimicrobiales bacterium]
MPATDRAPQGFQVQPEPWVAFRPTLDAMLEPLGDAVIARTPPLSGAKILDVGCGCGTTTLALAERVGPSGEVVGIDPSAPMLEVAREAAAARGTGAVSFVEGDAGTHPFEPHAFDVIFSRLGIMFFDEPDAAFANLRRALRRGGRLGFVCWRSLEENGWTTEPRNAVATIVPLPPPPPIDAPGPFSLGSEERIRSLLSEAGFMEVEIEAHDEPLLVGRGDIEEAIEFYLRLLPTGYLMFEPDRHLMDRIRVVLRTVLEEHHGPDGIRLGSATWVVRAR